MKHVSIEILRGETLTKIEGMVNGSEEVVFHTTYGRKFRMTHHQDCCESVYLDDVVGNPDDLIGCFLAMAEDVSSVTPDPDVDTNKYDTSMQWTFYKFGTIKGYVTLRWLGTSNGYYSTDVSFEEIK